MIQHKRFGRATGLPSTVQIVRELNAIMRRNADIVATAASSAPGAAVAPSLGLTSLEAR